MQHGGATAGTAAHAGTSVRQAAQRAGRDERRASFANPPDQPKTRCGKIEALRFGRLATPGLWVMGYLTRRVAGKAACQPNQNARWAGRRFSTLPEAEVSVASSICHVPPALSRTVACLSHSAKRTPGDS